MPQYLSHSPEDTRALGRRLAGLLEGGQLLAFTGGMGSGKTTFCQGLAQGLGCIDAVQSPTFSIANLYRGPQPLAHFDAWRITGEEDLEAAGFYDYLASGAVVALEWSEKLQGLLPPPDIGIDIATTGENSRLFTITAANDAALAAALGPGDDSTPPPKGGPT